MVKFAKEMLFCSFFLVLLLLPCPTVSKEVEDEKEFSYDNESENGPAYWGVIHHEWSLCGKGLMQSPIDLLDRRVEVVSHLGNLKRSYKASNATLRNRGHDIMLKWVEGGGSLEIEGTNYQLRQAHWHSPSEHTINGRRLDLELHLVHEGPAGETAVVGILYQIGAKPDFFLSLLKDDIEAFSGEKEEETAVGIRDPNLIRMGGGRRYYRYLGSLTVPPCSEGVSWTIIKQPRSVTYEQVHMLREAVHDESNARPLNPANKRTVQVFTTGSKENNNN